MLRTSALDNVPSVFVIGQQIINLFFVCLFEFIVICYLVFEFSWTVAQACSITTESNFTNFLFYFSFQKNENVFFLKKKAERVRLKQRRALLGADGLVCPGSTFDFRLYIRWCSNFSNYVGEERQRARACNGNASCVCWESNIVYNIYRDSFLVNLIDNFGFTVCWHWCQFRRSQRFEWYLLSRNVYLWKQSVWCRWIIERFFFFRIYNGKLVESTKPISGKIREKKNQ